MLIKSKEKRLKMAKRNSVNETADNIMKSYLTNPHVAEIAEGLKSIPMACPTCHTKGLVENGELRIEHCTFHKKLVDITFVDYICPTCGLEFIKYTSLIGGGIKEK